MFKGNKIILGAIIGVTALIGCLVIVNNLGYEKEQNKPVEILRDEITYTQVKYEEVKDDEIRRRMDEMTITSYNKYLVPLSDGSTIIAIPQVRRYYFMTVDEGDLDLEANSQQEIEKMIDTYISMKDTETN